MHLQASVEDQRVPAKQNKKLTFQEYMNYKQLDLVYQDSDSKKCDFDVDLIKE
jgi:hypothetical protein